MDAQTAGIAAWWARPRTDAANWIANYQKSLQVRHRTAISQIVGELGIGTLLEVGCHCGPNLIRLTAEHPGLQCAGVDVSAEAIAAGQRWAIERGVGPRVKLAAGAFPQVTAAVASGSYDAVLSCYSVAYLSPADLDAALFEMGRLARRAVILAEPMQVEGTGPAAMQQLSGYCEWAHDYQQAVGWIGTLRGMTTRVVPIHPAVDRLNAILVLTRDETIGWNTP